MSEATVRPFEAEVSQVLKLVVNSLYSHKEIFLRELISNASDAIDKLRFRSLSEPDLLDGETDFRIRVSSDVEAGTLTISDNGLGMSEQDMIEHLGTIARSGTRNFVEKLQQAKEQEGDLQLIGQFGVGFYSAFLVADRVTVVSRAAGSAEVTKWESDAKESYSVEPAERDYHGTDVVLHLGEEHKEFLKGFRLRELISRYSDYVEHPIELPTIESEEADKETEFERVNQGSALWQRNPKEVEQQQYEEFYKHLSHDWEPPVSQRHFKVEGTQLFAGLLFLPKRPPFDLFDASTKHGVRLHVRRVFVMENCEELLPKYLRFVKGLIDSDDLPLNVSRELLQDNRTVKIIRKQVVNHCLAMIEELADERPDDFSQFWANFGAVLKEGLHYSADDKERIAKLVRYESSTQEGVVSLSDYVSRMKDTQKSIYYAAGNSRGLLESSPHLERLKKHGYEVLFMTDPVDPFAVSGLGEFDGKPLVSAMDDKLELEENESDEQKEKRQAEEKNAEPLIERFKAVLADQVSEVRPSNRLTDSPVCLVTPEGGMAPHIERMMRAQNQDLPESKRILEVNPGHPVIENLKNAHSSDGESAIVGDWISLLYDQALIAEGSPVTDPGAFSRRLNKLLSHSTIS